MSEQISALVIDDDRMIRQILEKTMSSRGFDVYTAEDGPAGLALAAEHDLDAILLDWMMPGMDGMEVLIQLKQDDKTSHVPVFMLTSKDAGSAIDQAASVGVADYIVKPFNAFHVCEMIVQRLK